MTDLEREIDRDIYELAEAQMKTDLAFKQIEAKYHVKRMVMESSGEFTKEELLAMEEADEKAESSDKRGFLKKLIDTILEKIRSFINRFKKIGEDHEIGPDDDINMPVSEDEIKAYIKSADIINEKLDKVLQAAQGDSKEAYHKALQEYDKATENADWLDNISDEVLNAEKNQKAKSKVKNYIIKGSVILAACTAARKLCEAGEKVLGMVADAIATGTGAAAGKLFGKFKEDEINVEDEARGLESRVNKMTTRTGKLNSFFNRVLNRKAKDIDRKQKNADYDASRKALDDEENGIEGSADYKNAVFNKHREVEIFPWLNKYFGSNLNNVASYDYPRPRYKEEDKIKRYIVNTNGNLDESISNKVKKFFKMEGVEYDDDEDIVYIEANDDRDAFTREGLHDKIKRELENGNSFYTDRFRVKNGNIIAKKSVTLKYGVRKSNLHEVKLKRGQNLKETLWSSSGNGGNNSNSTFGGAFGPAANANKNGSSNGGNNGSNGSSSNSNSKGSKNNNNGSSNNSSGSNNSNSKGSTFGGAFGPAINAKTSNTKRMESTLNGTPIFFDFWGLFYRKGDYNEYKKRQHDLFDEYNKFREAKGLVPVKWDENIARKALEAMVSGDAVDDNGNTWQYAEDKGKKSVAKNSSSSSQNTDDGSKRKFLETFYQTKNERELVSKIEELIKKSDNNPDIDEDKIYGIPVRNIKSDFPTDIGGKDRKTEFVNEFKQKITNDSTLKGASEVGNLLTVASSNGLKWSKRDIAKYSESSNNAVKKAYGIMINLMKSFGWKEEYVA